MAKGNGNSRASASSNPRGLTATQENIIAVNARAFSQPILGRVDNPEAIRQDIADTENTIGELRAMQDDLYARIANERAYLEVEPENEVAIQGRIDELQQEANQVDEQINDLRIYIDKLQKRLK